MRVESGYSTGYSQRNVKEHAEFIAQSLNFMIPKLDADSVVVHGNSGVSAGFATLMLTKFNLCLLRKDGDNSHGSPLEGPSGHKLNRYVILDDCIDTGKTMDRIYTKLNNLYAQLDKRDKGSPPECVGILLYGVGDMDEFQFCDGHAVPVVSAHGPIAEEAINRFNGVYLHTSHYRGDHHGTSV